MMPSATVSALKALVDPKLTTEEALSGLVPNRPGLYAIYAAAPEWRQLGLGQPPDARPLYIRKAERSLVSRDLKTHFATGRTGHSSPRRSLAALLAADLKLEAIPRRPMNPEPRRWASYSLEEPGDVALTHWMRAKLQLAVWVRPADVSLAGLELEIMREWLPPLNLDGVKTPWTARVKATREILAEQAMQWARVRGFKLD